MLDNLLLIESESLNKFIAETVTHPVISDKCSFHLLHPTDGGAEGAEEYQRTEEGVEVDTLEKYYRP